MLLDSAAFGRAKAISVDYAIMEKTAHAAVLPVSFDWSDVGSWQAVWKLAPKDAADNAVQGKAHVPRCPAAPTCRRTRRW